MFYSFQQWFNKFLLQKSIFREVPSSPFMSPFSSLFRVLDKWSSFLLFCMFLTCRESRENTKHYNWGHKYPVHACDHDNYVLHSWVIFRHLKDTVQCCCYTNYHHLSWFFLRSRLYRVLHSFIATCNTDTSTPMHCD